MILKLQIQITFSPSKFQPITKLHRFLFQTFLQKEFSAENITFWTSCEEYRKLTSDADRHRAAIQILDKHLSTGAPEPVNVDSHARQAAQVNNNT